MLGDKIKELRKLEGITQTELARRVGRKPHYISQLENNIFRPSLKTLDKIAEVLKTRSSILLDGHTTNLR
ncbi:MAG: helix-turn-helix transcriptional regulator [Deltaproteobacteria bacterium]|nr:helix-turn-helix transcriptional regulator [Deltaproteobacteria bacterium]